MINVDYIVKEPFRGDFISHVLASRASLPSASFKNSSETISIVDLCSRFVGVGFALLRIIQVALNGHRHLTNVVFCRLRTDGRYCSWHRWYRRRMNFRLCRTHSAHFKLLNGRSTPLLRAILVVWIHLQMLHSQTFCFLDIRLLFIFAKDSPQTPQSSTDLSVVHLWILVYDLLPLDLGPHHEGIHRPLDVRLLGGLAMGEKRLSLAVASATARSPPTCVHTVASALLHLMYRTNAAVGARDVTVTALQRHLFSDC